MAGVFLSYRRSDAQDVAGRIFDRLAERFSRDAVFKDVDSIPLGAPFPAVLDRAIRSSDALLVLIGPTWLSCRNPDGTRRLDEPADFVRTEVETGLRLGLPTVPVTVGNAPMPGRHDLPEPLRPLAEREGQAVRPDPDFHRDVDRLIQRLVPFVKAPGGMALRLVTNRLDNDEFLFTGPPWPFPTDPRGEDVSSKHTPRSKRAALATHRPFRSDHPTVAAGELIIEFHLHNAAPTPWYLESLFLTVERVFTVTPAMQWNSWMPLLEPHRFEVTLDPARDFYELDFDRRLVEVPPNGAEHFRLRVTGGPCCAGRVFRFRLGAAAHDPAGAQVEIGADRAYHLAFHPDGPTPR